MSIRWIRNFSAEGKPVTVEVLLGDYEISDKCYVRINGGPEQWFHAKGETRDDVLNQGIELLKSRFKGQELKYSNGVDFDWK